MRVGSVSRDTGIFRETRHLLWRFDVRLSVSGMAAEYKILRTVFQNIVSSRRTDNMIT